MFHIVVYILLTAAGSELFDTNLQQGDQYLMSSLSLALENIVSDYLTIGVYV